MDPARCPFSKRFVALSFSAMCERREATTDEELIPVRTVLIEEQDRLSRRARARPGTRCLNFHERDQAVNLRLLWCEPGQDASEPQRILAERGPHPVVAGGRRVAFVEDEVDDPEHRRQTRGQFRTAGNFKRNALFGESALGPNDALGDGRLWNEEGSRNLVGRQTSEQAKCERYLSFGGENWMTGDEDQSQQVIADIVVESRIQIGHGHLFLSQFTAKLLVLAVEHACFGGSDQSHDASL